MNYISTRGKAPVLKFDDALLAGLAEDGGLYVPESWPKLRAEDFAALQGVSYTEAAVQIMQPFVGRELPEKDFISAVESAYAVFENGDPAPLVELEEDLYLLELFHGPTLAFKDVALQLLGQLFDRVLARRKSRITVVGATSGDTGSAAIEACRDRDNVDIFILHPHNRVSDVQRRQMTTVLSPNVHNIAVEGSFDDCQDIVKSLFNDPVFRMDMKLSAVNSINWARIMAQIVYYVVTAVKLGAPDNKLSFAVPTGNFGNVYAAYAAKQMGVPVDRLIIGTNRNDILHRFFESGEMTVGEVVPTLSPSMDIQISSNFERFLFDVLDRDAAELRTVMAAFRETGTFSVAGKRLARCRDSFLSYRLDDEGTKNVIRRVQESYGRLVDPHTAVGLAAAAACKDGAKSPIVAVATAHPAKFPDAVKAATGIQPELPPSLADLFQREERYDVLPNDLRAVADHIRGRARAARAA